jgi:hypothetical protein
MEHRYCGDPTARSWNEDRCHALGLRQCTGETCTYRHFGSCSGVLLGGGVLLTAAHCVDGMLDHPERKAGSVVLRPAPHGRPAERLPFGDIVVGKQDVDHDRVVVSGEHDPVDVAAVTIDDRGLPRLETAPLPATGEVVLIAGYPRVERRSAEDCAAAGYALTFGTLALSFGRIADRNPDDLPLCSTDPQERFDPAARMVAIPSEQALRRLDLPVTD